MRDAPLGWVGGEHVGLMYRHIGKREGGRVSLGRAGRLYSITFF